MGPFQDEIHYIKGKIINSDQSDDLSAHGSVWTEQVYKVLGEDDNIYVGCYGNGVIGNCFIRTVEDYKKRLNSKINLNEEKMEKLEEENKTYKKIIDDLEKNKVKTKIKSV